MNQRIRACFEMVLHDIEEIEEKFISRNFDTVELRKAKKYLFRYFTVKKKIERFRTLMNCYAEISTVSIEYKSYGIKSLCDNALKCLRVIVSWLCKFRGRLEDVQ